MSGSEIACFDHCKYAIMVSIVVLNSAMIIALLKLKFIINNHIIRKEVFYV